MELLKRKLLLQNRPGTVRQKLSVIRAVMRRAYLEGAVSHRTWQKLRDTKTMPKTERSGSGRMLSVDEFRRAWAVIDRTTSRGRLEAATLMAFCTTGLRVGEFIGLKHEDYTAPVLEITNTKTYVTRDVRASLPMQHLLADHIKDQEDLEPWLFQGVGDGYEPGKLSRDKVAYMFERIAKRADIAAFTPHDLRRTTASTLLGNNVDVCTVANVLGHSNVNTTRGYDRRPEQERVAAFQKLSDIFMEASNG